jgi:myo-inositol-1(or 4)-monophosphatase
VSIAAERDGRTIAGAVVAPALDEAYIAARHGGAWSVRGSLREPVHVSGVADLSDAVVSTGFGYDPQRRARQGAVVARLVGEVRDIRRIGSAALDLCWVARGRIDAHYECGLHPWDWSAAALIVAEAGGIAGDLDGGPPSRAMTAAGPPELFGQLVERRSRGRPAAPCPGRSSPGLPAPSPGRAPRSRW